MRAARPIRSLYLALGLILAAAAAAAPAGECPQPRYTGKAPDEYYQRQNPLPASTDLRSAQRTYKGDGDTISCAACHGEKGDGKGRMSGQFDPRPRNFACAQTVNGIPDGQLFWIIRYGAPGGAAAMPPHPKLSDQQIWELVLLLRRFAS